MGTNSIILIHMCSKPTMLELFTADKARDSYGLVTAGGCVSDGDPRRHPRGLHLRCLPEGGDL